MSSKIIGANSEKLKRFHRKKLRRKKRATQRRIQRRRRRISRQAGAPRSALRKMLQPLQTAIFMTITEEKEKSWFPILPMLAQIVCGIFYNLFGLPSMRDTVEKVNNSSDLEIGGEICLSTFSDSVNSPRRLEVLRQVFKNLLLCFPEQIPSQLKKFRHIAAIDSTIIHCVFSSVWAQYRKAVKACKAHLLFDLEKGIPKTFVISAAKIHDSKYFEIFLKKGWTYVVDRAYNVYSLFDKMIESGIHFVTRLKSTASYQIVKQKKVKRRHRKIGVISDKIIRLGSGSNEMKNLLRLVEFKAEDEKVYHFLTDRFDLAPTSVAALYEARWAIEIFFKFFKRTLRGVRLLGRSEIGAEVHVFFSLITDLLLKLLAKAIGCFGSVKRHVPVSFLRTVRDSLFRTWSVRFQMNLAKTLT